MSAIVYPLAFPKGIKYACELCQKPAHKICEKCRVTFYCDEEHQRSDWVGIHEKICQSLIPLRAPQPFLPSEEERKQRDQELYSKKMELVEYTRSISQRYLFEGDYARAVPGAMTSLRYSIELKGLKSVELVPSYIILGEANQGLGNLGQAQEYLSQAEWTVKKNPDCPLPILSRVYRNVAMLQMAKGDFEEALRNLANDIYNASEEYGINDVHVSGGYFLMANIFFKLEQMDIADSLYRQVCKMWHTHLRHVVQEQTKMSELDTILGKKEEEIDHEKLELATQAEANKVLHSIYEIRRNEQNTDENEITIIEHCLSMVHFLAKQYEIAVNFATIVIEKENLSDGIRNEVNQMINFINMK